ncbi:CHASE3 domain-containing protein [Xylophilus ampelinus]|uniref:Histidine kinase/DNA gyrase B/HSP90-like ATPase n=1 Tax=Xylophilus ampelinus TaxID=54067 RepID=A0A318SRJ8_9BURK|nr:CHASE3 domain-containing protein [Xylophilus ampelinus]MCS4511077.1 CHASE3 domain-containing protein [Xylophilus ampelinus]PYE75929.1 histidine kinase/DNA gyrase B/HSP90-like ATPase [Xylophilus ampelinus]
MGRFSIPGLLLRLPAAVLAAALLIGINETGYRRSHEALQEIAQAQSIRTTLGKLMTQVLDAETGQRGYLLTGETRYLEPYDKAFSGIGQTMEELQQLYGTTPERTATLEDLNRELTRKLAEIDLAVTLRKQGNQDAWRFVLLTDIGREHMDAIRGLTSTLMAQTHDAVDAGQQQVVRALQLSRLGIAGVALAGLLAFSMYLRQTTALKASHRRQKDLLEQERNGLELQVRERTARLTELATHLQQVREEERAHLARELHDELGSLLTAAKLDVARIKSRVGTESPELNERMLHLTETLNSGIALKRRIIEDLRPSSLSNLGLVAALEILARESGDQLGFAISADLEEVKLDDTAELTAYRLVQESFTNIGKHADARHVTLSLRAIPGFARVEVRDDGRGFPVDSIAPASHGLAGMRHRVEAAGGQLTIGSEPGQGTVVSALLPTHG